MTASETIRLRSGFEQLTHSIRLVKPHEIATNLGLILAIDNDRIVRGGTSKIVAPLLLRMIGIRAWVEQKFAPTDGQRESKRIGMAMRRNRQVAQGPASAIARISRAVSKSLPNM